MPSSDEYFSTLIPQGEALIAAGRPATPFSALRWREPAAPRLECDLRALTVVAAPAAPTPAMRAAYAGLLREIRRFDPGQVLFTALEPGQGTTFTAANVAALWAEDAPEESVLYFEAYSGPHEEAPLLDASGELCRDARKLEAFLGATATANFFRLNVAAGAAALDGMGELWARLTATFARVFIDASPAGYNPLAPWLGAHASGVALVARKAPDGRQVKKFTDALTAAGGRFMGVVLNA